VHRHHEILTENSEQPETLGPHDRTPAVMAIPPLLLALAGAAVGLIPAVRDGVDVAAARLTDRARYVAHVLSSGALGHPHAPHAPLLARDYVLGATTLAGALLVAGGALYSGRRPALLDHLEERTARIAVALRHLHSGQVTDYIAWLTAALAAVGGALVLT
jgi:multicomponent Na+:H+ antiporter subunit D